MPPVHDGARGYSTKAVPTREARTMTTLETPRTHAGSSTVTTTLERLHRWIGAASKAAAAPKDNRQALQYILVTAGTGGGTLAVATDGYTLAALRIETEHNGEAFIVPAKEILAAIKQAYKVKAARTMSATLSCDGITWTLASGSETWGGLVTWDVDLFPKWRGLLDNDGTVQAAAFGATTFGTIADMLDTLGDSAALFIDHMQDKRAMVGHIVGADGITGKVAAMSMRANSNPQPL